MRSLAQPKVFRSAGLAALLTSAACYPRLASWPERESPALYLWFILLWALFVLWSFVFAWQFRYAHREVVRLDFQPGHWGVATLCGAAFAAIAHFWVDPQLRLISPGDYPTSINSWLARSLFAVGFEPLFFCFAPFAFFIRLFRKQEVALVLTVLWGIFILALRLGSSATLPPIWVVMELMAVRLLAAFISVYFYLKGGALVVCWMTLLLQLRYLAELLSPR